MHIKRHTYIQTDKYIDKTDRQTNGQTLTQNYITQAYVKMDTKTGRRKDTERQGVVKQTYIKAVK